MAIRWITCAECGKPTPATGAATQRCQRCAPRRAARPATSTAVRQRKRLTSQLSSRRGPEWMSTDPPSSLIWQVGVDVPFTWALSKNHIYQLGHGGVHLRTAHREAREDLTTRMRAAMHRAGAVVVQNKVWIDVLVEKSNHRGDAINVVDGVCDAVKKAIRVDDRWYCIRRLDWEVVPEGGRIYVAIGQDSTVECQVCSDCGRILPSGAFGSGRRCGDCRAIVRSERRASLAVTQ